MTNRIDNCFEHLRSRGGKAFIPYICAGDPTLARTIEIAKALEAAGGDILELGVPFSDPLADGTANQLASQRALEAGASVPGVLECVRSIRRSSQIPVVLYTYLNPILQFGWTAFHDEAAASGVDGLLILDLPPDEDLEMESAALFHIRLIAPTTPQVRIATIAAAARGFIYYVSREGVTGARRDVESSVAERVSLIRRETSLPVVVGFGISTPEQVAEVAGVADGVVIGSAIVQQIAEHGEAPDLPRRITAFVAPFASATKLNFPKIR